MVTISEEQIKVAYPDREEVFRWCNQEHVEIFINEQLNWCKWVLRQYLLIRRSI